MDLLAALDIDTVADRRTGAVSGGQAQRAAVARALAHRPTIVLADEPTGSLDTVSAEVVLEAMVSLSTQIGAVLLVVTHDNIVAAHLDRHVVIEGRCGHRSRRGASMIQAVALGLRLAGGGAGSGRLRSGMVAAAAAIGACLLVGVAAIARAE